MKDINRHFWNQKKVFVTGHTGFKGSWLSLWLKSLGAIVGGFSLYPPTNPSLFEEACVSEDMVSLFGDIRDLECITKSMVGFDPEILIHMAAQPLVRLSYEKPVDTYETNIMGSINVLEAARKCQNLKAIVNVTTDKCYENREWSRGYKEDDHMGGHDPYSSSKGCVELITSAYRRSFFSKNNTACLASARAGNVIGGGDWAIDRLLPDIMRAFTKNEPVIIRNPSSTRPWQHVLEPLNGYLCLAQKLFEHGEEYAEAWNFGPYHDDVKPVSWVLEKMVDKWDICNSWKYEQKEQHHEAKLLQLDISKSLNRLNWKPLLNLSKAIDLTIQWQKSWLAGDNVRQTCLRQIQQFQMQQDVS
jgi:CDP-glucose 4,6-dehydratase